MPGKRSKVFPACRVVADFLDRELQVARISDQALNGLQIEGDRPVRVVATAVDASLATFQAAHKAKADLLLVHHGLFWGKPYAWTGMHAQRIKALFQAGIGLYASHLPLDAHPRLGNNVLLARGLGLKLLKPFGVYHGQTIGVRGTFSRPLSRKELSQKISTLLHIRPKVLTFGPEKIRTAAIVSGGGSDMVQQAWETSPRCDAFITGEASHITYHPCQEAGLNLFLAGHYATETLGVKALGQCLEKKYGIRSIFLDLPTGM